jgi:hypothetical protein
MYDSVNVASYPANTGLALGYVDGRWPDAAAVQARFPKARVFTLTTTVAGAMTAEGYDCEKGDGDALSASEWAQRKLTAGKRPLIYCSRVGTAGYGWPWVLSNLKALGIPQANVDFGIADATGVAHLVPGSVFTQWGQGGNGAFDISMTNGIWPYAAPAPPLPPTPTPKMEDMPYYVTNSTGTGYVIALDLSTKLGIQDAIDAQALLATGNYTTLKLTDPQIAAIPNA